MSSPCSGCQCTPMPNRCPVSSAAATTSPVVQATAVTSLPSWPMAWC